MSKTPDTEDFLPRCDECHKKVSIPPDHDSDCPYFKTLGEFIEDREKLIQESEE